jgi:sphingomyelin phosphodiesterase acid-like 3
MTTFPAAHPVNRAGAIAMVDAFVSRLTRFLPALIAAVSLTGELPVFAQESQAREFLIFSDLHYNSKSTSATRDLMGKDANPELVQSALASAANVCKAPLFVLNLGDSLPHGENADQAPDRISELTNSFQKYLPNTAVFGVLGNNDTEKDYQIQSPAFLRAFVNSWVPAKYAYHVSSNGWYAANLPGLTNCRFLGLNSTFFSARCDKSAKRDQGATDQLNWVMDEVRRARADKASLWLGFHIPPTLNPVDTSKHLWNEKLERQFVGILATNSDVIKAVLCGHIHRDEIRVIYDRTTPVLSIHFSPAISPVYLNNPGFQVFSTTPTGEILDYRTCYRPLSSNPTGTDWVMSEPFTKKFGVTDMSPMSLDLVRSRLAQKSSINGKPIKDIYLSDYSVESVAATMPIALSFGSYVTQMGLTNNPVEAKSP